LKFRLVLWSLVILIGIFGFSLKSFGGEKCVGGFAVHVASFRDGGKAEREAEYFRAQGLTAFQEAVKLGEKGTWYRVYAGCSESEEDVKARLREIKKLRPSGSMRMVKLDGPHQKASPGISPRKAPDPAPVEEVKAAPPSPEIPPALRDEKTAPPASRKTEIEPVVRDEGSAPPASSKTEMKRTEIRPEPEGNEEGASTDRGLNTSGGLDCGTALPLLKKAADDSKPGSAGRDRLFHDYADCAFASGLEGDEGLLLSSIDYYRHLLRMRRGTGTDDDLIHFRIARSFEEIKFYYEARGSYETLLVLHPLSVYAEEALFKVAKMMFRTEKFQDAVDTFTAYLKRYPDGRFAKEAYFSAGVACDRLGKPYYGEIWFRDGMKKWPAYQDIPEEFLFDLGNHFVIVNKYDDALSVFAEYASLYPKLSTTKKALLGAGMSLYEKGQPGKAIFLFSLVLDRFPGSVEGDESMLMLARIAGEKPGIQLPRAMKGWEVMHDPVEAFNRVYEKHGNEAISEKALFYKARYLDRKERWTEAVETCLAMEDLWLWGWGAHKQAALSLLKSGTDHLVERYANDGDDVSVSALYYRTCGKGWIRPPGFSAAFIMGTSLGKMGDLEEAGKVYEEAFVLAKSDKDRVKALSSMVDLACRNHQYEDALKSLDRVLAERDAGDRTAFSAMVREKKAEVRFLMGEREKALSIYESLSQPSWTPVDPVTAHSNFGRSLEEAGKWEGAVQNYDKVLEWCRDSGKCREDKVLEAERRRANCLFMASKYGEGLLSYEVAVDREKEKNMQLWTLYRIGQGYALSGETGKSRVTLNHLKERGEEEFWVSLADWWSYDHQWMNAHGRLLDNPGPGDGKEAGGGSP